MGIYNHKINQSQAYLYYVQSFSFAQLDRIDNSLLKKALENIKKLSLTTDLPNIQ